jgi:hypothetical protein
MAQSGSFPITKGRVPKWHLENANPATLFFSGGEHTD